MREGKRGEVEEEGYSDGEREREGERWRLKDEERREALATVDKVRGVRNMKESGTEK